VEPIIVVCCVCQRQRVGPGKAEIYADAPSGGYPPDVRLSHTYCPKCLWERFGIEPEDANTCSPTEEEE
jgi:hypothetical protein